MNDFKSLEEDLDAFFDTAYSKLPDELRDRVDKAFLVSWECLDADQRREAARQWDYQHDPATHQEREEFERTLNRKFKIDEQIKDWEATSTPTASDFQIKKLNISRLKKRLLELGGGDTDVDEYQSFPVLPNLETSNLIARFVLVGDHWEISFDGVTKTFNNTTGLRYIAYLIRHQGKQVHVRDLYYAINPTDSSMVNSTHSAMGSEQLEEQGLSIGDLGDAGDAMTPEGKERIETEIRRLQEQIEDAKELGNTERQAELEEKQEAILKHLANETGLGGRSRKSSSSVERIRKSVTNRIKADIEKIAGHLPTLGHHLSTQLQTGTRCRYAPEPPVEWDFSAN